MVADKTHAVRRGGRIQQTIVPVLLVIFLAGPLNASGSLNDVPVEVPQTPADKTTQTKVPAPEASNRLALFAVDPAGTTHGLKPAIAGGTPGQSIRGNVDTFDLFVWVADYQPGQPKTVRLEVDLGPGMPTSVFEQRSRTLAFLGEVPVGATGYSMHVGYNEPQVIYPTLPQVPYRDLVVDVERPGVQEICTRLGGCEPDAPDPTALVEKVKRELEEACDPSASTRSVQSCPLADDSIAYARELAENACKDQAFAAGTRDNACISKVVDAVAYWVEELDKACERSGCVEFRYSEQSGSSGTCSTIRDGRGGSYRDDWTSWEDQQRAFQMYYGYRGFAEAAVAWEQELYMCNGGHIHHHDALPVYHFFLTTTEKIQPYRDVQVKFGMTSQMENPFDMRWQKRGGEWEVRDYHYSFLTEAEFFTSTTYPGPAQYPLAVSSANPFVDCIREEHREALQDDAVSFGWDFLNILRTLKNAHPAGIALELLWSAVQFNLQTPTQCLPEHKTLDGPLHTTPSFGNGRGISIRYPMVDSKERAFSGVAPFDALGYQTGHGHTFEGALSLTIAQGGKACSDCEPIWSGSYLQGVTRMYTPNA